MLRSLVHRSIQQGWNCCQRRCLIQLANRPYLPMSDRPGFPKTLQEPHDDLPYIVNANMLGLTETATPAECASSVKDDIGDLLLKHGAVLFRDFPIHDAEGFSEFFVGLGKYEGMGYKGGQAVRNHVTGDVYTASDDSPAFTIEPHNEMAYLNVWPTKLLFFCEIPAGPGCGGETVLGRTREIMERMDKGVLDKFDTLGIMYHHHALDKYESEYKSWQEIFFTDDKKSVEEHLKKNDQQFKWESNGGLSWWWTLSAFDNHPITGERMWFNQAHKKHSTMWNMHPFWKPLIEKHNIPPTRLPTHAFYGDGSDISDEVVQHIRGLSWEVAVGFQMKRGDCVIFDNHLIQHARMSFTGDRKLLAVLAADKKD